MRLAHAITALLCVAWLSTAGLAQAKEYSEAEAYSDVLSWASGSKDSAYLLQLRDAIERAAYRNSISPEFALAVVSAEAKYGNQVSFARWDSWNMYRKVTGVNATIPSPLEDTQTAFAELRQILDTSKTLTEVYKKYWCGVDGSYNQDSLKQFSEAVNKIYAGLKPYAEAREKARNSGRYKPAKSSDAGAGFDTDPIWTGVANGDMSGYSTRLGSMPKLASKLRSFPDAEGAYAAVARSFNKNLGTDESLVIARAVLSYCHDIDPSFETLDPRLVMAVVAAESRFKCKAVSRCGALGLGQLMPGTAKGLGIRDPLDPIQNLYGCVKYLEREMYRWRKHNNKLDLVLASYNAGAGAVQKYGGVPPYDETRSYVRIVKKYYSQFRAR